MEKSLTASVVLLFKNKNNQTKWPLVITHKLENHQDDYNSHHSTFYGENVIKPLSYFKSVGIIYL